MKMPLGTRRLFVLAQVVVHAVVFNLVVAPAMSLAAQDSKPIRIVAFGDSLTAGFNLKPSEAFPSVLQRELSARGQNVAILNSGVSGDTTASGRQRFDWAIPEGTEAVILELGANDALRGIDPELARAQLEAIVLKLKQRNIEVLLAGMTAPRNWGEDYVRAFNRIYPDLARKHGLLHYPFFLDGVALKPELNLPDGLHPNAKGVEEIARRMIPAVEELIARARKKRLALEKG